MKRLAILAALLLAACRNEQPAQTATTTTSAAPAQLAGANVRDPHSYARPEEARVEHIGLDLTVDFATKKLDGTANLRIRKQQGATKLMLDTNGLDIRKVTL